jgi:hypothetical protein
MTMVRSISAAILLIFAGIMAHAQGEDNSLKGVPPKERVVLGGGLGLGFGSDQDYVMLSPSIGYLLTQKLMGGVNLTYQYTKYKYFTPSITSNSYGGGPFARYMIFRGIFIHTEYEYLSYEFFDTRKGYSSFLAGGGFIQPIGGNRAAFYLLALYNFLYETPRPGEYVPYSSPIVIRAGISLGRFGLF